MKPYYEHKGITIYHGDCREVLPRLSPDLIVTDPPYGVGMEAFDDDLRLFSITADVVSARGLVSFMSPAKIAAAIDLVKPSWVYANCLWWWKVSDIAHPWHGWHQNAEAVLIFTNGKAFPKARVNRPNTYELMVNGREIGHPCAKPIEIIQHCLLNLCSDGELVVDPFVGSGSTLIAAKITGNPAIGIEIEEKYCEIAAKRLSQEVFEFN